MGEVIALTTAVLIALALYKLEKSKGERPMNNSKRRHDGGAYRRYDTMTSLYCRPCKDRTKSRQKQQHKKKGNRK